MEPKRVKDSSVTVVQQMTQQDANLAGNVHGGVIMKLIDNTAGIVGVRHTGGNVVTASIDRLDFHSPVFVGDLLRVSASINYVGKTSMEIGVRVEAENFVTGEVRHTASAYLTFVSLDEKFKPRPIPPIILESDDEKRRNCEAQMRRAARLQAVEEGKTKCKI
ncbi:MAG TPA: acyl-CoA thioesterase [Spirochaetota bacterium]|nr:acyl-CoA thioesterase [Spirochaetota bacterium]HOK92837.1 acyl-CoA thioesterase [Spirochaetota bacterium]HON15977.1 acyl-CoA thioesterase [Spirochaetota bacterium]HPP95490.1 acyl-CoA thioesterase [Spirochaetota bacterium]